MPRPILDGDSSDDNENIYSSKYDKDFLIKNMLWGEKLKATPGRVSLLRALEANQKPLTLTGIRGIVKKLSRSAIFRGLEDLIEADLVCRVNIGSVEPAYEIVLGRRHHHHVICTKCKDIEDVTVCPLNDIVSHRDNIIIGLKKFGMVYNHSLEFFGICKKCAK